MAESNYSRYTIKLIILSSIIRLLLAGIVELNNDEVYYWSYAQHLQWNYFDHPPMIALVIRCFTFNLLFHNELFIRLGAIICCALSTWVMFKIGGILKDGQTGWICSCIYTASFYGSVIAGLLILPDSPQVLFWLMSVYTMLSLVNEKEFNRRDNMRLLVLGILIGFCILCKIHGIFLWFGFLCYIIFLKRELLSNIYLYLAILLTILIVLPSLLWVIDNDFSTYTYHSKRVSFIGHFQFDNFIRELVGTILYNNPIVFFLTLSGIIYYIKNKLLLYDGHRQLLFWLSFPLIGVLLVISFFNDTLPHWSGPAYLTVIPFGALYVTSRWRINNLPVVIPSKVKAALYLTISALIASFLLINFYPSSLGKKTLPQYGAGDVTLDMSGWDGFKNDFKHFLISDNKNKNLLKPGYIFSDYWFPAGHLAFYVAQPLHMNILAVGSLSSIHNFAWLNRKVPLLQKGLDAYYINVSNFYNAPPVELVKLFGSVSQPVLIPQFRSGVKVRYFYIYRLIDYKGGLPANGLIE